MQRACASPAAPRPWRPRRRPSWKCPLAQALVKTCQTITSPSVAPGPSYLAEVGTVLPGVDMQRNGLAADECLVIEDSERGCALSGPRGGSLTTAVTCLRWSRRSCGRNCQLRWHGRRLPSARRRRGVAAASAIRSALVLPEDTCTGLFAECAPTYLLGRIKDMGYPHEDHDRVAG